MQSHCESVTHTHTHTQNKHLGQSDSLLWHQHYLWNNEWGCVCADIIFFQSHVVLRVAPKRVHCPTGQFKYTEKTRVSNDQQSWSQSSSLSTCRVFSPHSYVSVNVPVYVQWQLLNVKGPGCSSKDHVTASISTNSSWREEKKQNKKHSITVGRKVCQSENSKLV